MAFLFPSWNELGIPIGNIKTAVERNEPIRVELKREIFDFLKDNEQQLRDIVSKECGSHVSTRLWLHDDKENRVCMLRTFRVRIPGTNPQR
jgi:hypothetical protein